MPDAKDIQKAAAVVARAETTLSVKQRALVDLVCQACDEGMAEQAAAEAAGVSRMTVRRWRGKHTWRDQHQKN